MCLYRAIGLTLSVLSLGFCSFLLPFSQSFLPSPRHQRRLATRRRAARRHSSWRSRSSGGARSKWGSSTWSLRGLQTGQPSSFSRWVGITPPHILRAQKSFCLRRSRSSCFSSSSLFFFSFLVHDFSNPSTRAGCCCATASYVS